MKLSDGQLAIVHAPKDRHIKVTAAPGSGKSTVCCHRIKHLISTENVNPKRILATMFNSDAVSEFEQGLLKLGVGMPPPIRTYHTAAKRCLEGLEKAKVIDKAKLEPNDFIVNKIKLQALYAQADEFPDTNVFAGVLFEKLERLISISKSDDLPPEQAIELMGGDKEANVLIAAYHRYELERVKLKIRTFDDLLVDIVRAMEANERARKAIASKIDHIIVDEYQDINGISQRFIELLASEGAFVMVVGDDDQTISEFRGAKPYFIIEGFDKKFPNTITYKLEHTYRYGHVVSLLANNCIRHNKNRIEKWCVSPSAAPNTSFDVKLYENKQGIPHHCIEQRELIEEIKKQYDATGQYSDVGVLVRVFSITPYIEAALIDNEIPYVMDGGTPLLETKSFKSLVFILCLAFYKTPPADKLRKWITELIGFPRLPVKKTVARELIQMLINNASMSEIKSITKHLKKFPRTITQSRCEAILSLMNEEYDYSSVAVKQYAREAQINFSYRRSTKDEEVASRNIAMFSAFEAIFGKPQMTLKEALTKWLALQNAPDDDEGVDSIKITSVHRSKGLAWPLVVIPGLCEGVFPHSKGGKVDNMEAERRLYFVAITRAKQRLVLLTANDKKLQKALEGGYIGRHSNSLMPNEASRFIFESYPSESSLINEAVVNGESLDKLKGHPKRTWFNNYLLSIESDYRVIR